MSSNNPVILLIEDEEDVRLSLQEFLEEADYYVIDAVDGDDGIRAIQTHRPDPGRI